MRKRELCKFFLFSFENLNDTGNDRMNIFDCELKYVHIYTLLINIFYHFCRRSDSCLFISAMCAQRQRYNFAYELGALSDTSADGILFYNAYVYILHNVYEEIDSYMYTLRTQI